MGLVTYQADYDPEPAAVMLGILALLGSGAEMAFGTNGSFEGGLGYVW